MSNLVLYRKYRPQTFSEIVGQEHVVRTICNAIASDSAAHAYLFAGPRGTGKTTIARILAKSLNCVTRKTGESEPCDKCSSCQEISQGKALDVIEIDAASNRGIDEIRNLKEAIRTVPTSLKFKFYIIDECHMLTREAFNALLKTLEEPPSHAIFVLATTEIHKIPATILSRTQRFDFKKLNLDEIAGRLATLCGLEMVKIEKSARDLIALNSGGSVRDAESLLNQVIAYGESRQGKEITKKDIEEILGIADTVEAIKFIESLAQKNSAAAFLQVNNLYERGFDMPQFAKSIIDYLRYLMFAKIDKGLLNPRICGFSDDDLARICSQCQNFSEEKLRKTIEIFIEAQNEIKRSPIPQLPLELAIMETMEQLQN